MRYHRIARATIFAVLVTVIGVYGSAGASTWLDVPYVHQAEAGCGAASIAMVMQYWIRQDARLDSHAADGDRIFKLLSAPSKKGISGQALKTYLEEHGFDAFVFDGELEDLRAHIQKGRPVVVCLAPRGSRAPLHFAVVVGVDENNVTLNDPARGKLFREDVNRFLRDWKTTGAWALLAVPHRTQ